MALMTAVALAGLLYLNRRAAAREVLVGWLDQRGIQADVDVERIELDGFVGRVRIGDPRNPDVVVERVEVDYLVGLPWSRSGVGVTPSRIRLVRPVLRASWKNGRLSLGSLDPLLEEFSGRPPRPDARGPLVIVEGGRARVDTDYGAIQLLADARVDNGKLMRLQASAPSTPVLQSGEVEARGVSARIDLTTAGDRVAVRLEAGAESFQTPAVNGRTARLLMTGSLPYPDLKRRRGDGRALLDLQLAGDVLGVGDVRLRDAALSGRFDGLTAGWLETFRIQGATRLGLDAEQIDAPGLQATQMRTTAASGRLVVERAQGLRWSLQTPVTLEAASGAAGDLHARRLSIHSSALSMGGRDAAFEMTGETTAVATELGFGDLSLKRARSRLNLDVVHDGATRIEAEGALASADGAWPLFGPEGVDDLPDLRAMKRALGGFSLGAPAFRFQTGTGGTQVTLLRPATVTPGNGGVLTVAQAGGPAYEAEAGRPGGGALRLTATRGRGLPEMAVSVPSWRLTDGGFEARLDGRAQLDFDLARGLDAQSAGLLAMSDGRLTYAPDGCVALQVERLELDENDVHQVGGRLCADNGPLLSGKNGVWRVAGDLRNVDAQAPFLQMRFSDAFGQVAVNGRQGGLALTAELADARVIDTAEQPRFNPLAVNGEARLANERWSGAFDLAGTGRAAGTPLGRLTLVHDGRSGAGGVNITAPNIVFAEDALQPSMLSPLAADYLQSPVVGAVGFEGAINWTKDAEPTSSGLLSVPGLDFTSPAGELKGLRGEVAFTSLTPLITAPNQRLTADSLAIGTDVTAVDLSFGIDAAGVNVSAGSLSAAGGTVSVEPFSVPLDPSQGFAGVIVLDRIQFGEVVADTGFDDKVLLDAVVSGRLPFTFQPTTGLKVAGGSLAAVQPGRLSIRREVLSDVAAGGGGDVPPGMVEDLAYQAMENLAFDVLSADVNSLDGGRVSVLFHIQGRHAPPQRQELRLTLAELISRRFLDRTLPLPSGTEIDLTLDTTLNANQLVSDLLAVNRARNGAPEDDE